MWPLIMGAARTYAPYITLPFAAVIGFIGYNIEWSIRKEPSPFKADSIEEERSERKLREFQHVDATQVDTLKSRKDIPKTILGRNENLNEKR